MLPSFMSGFLSHTPLTGSPLIHQPSLCSASFHFQKHFISITIDLFFASFNLKHSFSSGHIFCNIYIYIYKYNCLQLSFATTRKAIFFKKKIALNTSLWSTLPTVDRNPLTLPTQQFSLVCGRNSLFLPYTHLLPFGSHSSSGAMSY